MNYPKIVKIEDLKKENNDVKTLAFSYKKLTKPGQYFMIWIPNVDEIPMSVSSINKDKKSITFKRVGEATKKLFDLKIGDKIGVRGPFGHGFDLFGNNILFVSGGTGASSMIPAVEEANNKNKKSTVLLGFKNKNEIYFQGKLTKLNIKAYISTDDGSYGYKGFVTSLAEEMISKEKYDQIITCGPEKMMRKMLEISKKIPFQASLERYMKCSMGICGQCTIGNGLRVCKEGPVFTGEILKKIKDFGIYKRDASGKKIKL